MPFFRRSPRIQAAPVQPPRESFFYRLLHPNGVVRRSRNFNKSRATPVVGHKSRTGFGRKRRAVPVRETRVDQIIGHHQQRRPSLGDKIHGFGRRLAGSLSGRPREKATGARIVRSTNGRGARRRRFF
jgi:hypothetical protein